MAAAQKVVAVVDESSTPADCQLVAAMRGPQLWPAPATAEAAPVPQTELSLRKQCLDPC